MPCGRRIPDVLDGHRDEVAVDSTETKERHKLVIEDEKEGPMEVKII